MSDMQSSYQNQSNYQYTLADVPKLAEQATNLYAHNPAEKESYMKYYTEFYTNQISTVKHDFLKKYFLYNLYLLSFTAGISRQFGCINRSERYRKEAKDEG